MTDPSAASSNDPSPDSPPSGSQDIDATRMSFGDHLEELRVRLIRALLGVAVCAGVALYFAGDLLSFVLQPALAVLRANGQEASLQVLSPPDSFLIYLKIGLLCGLIVAMPWVLYQLWLFIAAGLYQHERKFVGRFAPVSILLFAAGVLFMFYIVLPIVLNFFVVFSMRIPMPDVEPSFVQRWMFKSDVPASQPAAAYIKQVVPLVDGMPPDPEPGEIWYNARTHEIQLHTSEGTRGTGTKLLTRHAPINSQFGLNFYISFILTLSLAFGLAFEVPILVIFLVLTRIVTASGFSRSRKYVIFGTVVVAALITPPDVISQIMLAVPVLFLFEGGLFVGKMIEKQRAAEDAAG
jgi:sec-independent protein translocase protein TatC